MDKSDRLDVYLVAGGKWHNIDYARLELLKLMAEQPKLKIQVGSDYSQIDEIYSGVHQIKFMKNGEFTILPNQLHRAIGVTLHFHYHSAVATGIACTVKCYRQTCILTLLGGNYLDIANGDFGSSSVVPYYHRDGERHLHKNLNPDPLFGSAAF